MRAATSVAFDSTRFLVPVLVEPLDARLRTQFGDGPRETPPSVVAFDARRAGAVALQHGGDERFGRFHAERRIKYVRYVNGVVCPCFVADRAQVVLSRVRRIGVVPLFYRPFGQFVVGGETVSVEHALGRRGISLIHRFE